MSSAKLTELLICGICRETMFHPVTLICQHSACKNCLKNIKTKTCPMCRLKFVLPKEYNRTLDDVCKIADAAVYKQHQLDADKKIIEVDVRAELKNELYNELVNQQLEDFGNNPNNNEVTQFANNLLNGHNPHDITISMQVMSTFLKLFAVYILMHIVESYVLDNKSWLFVSDVSLFVISIIYVFGVYLVFKNNNRTRVLERYVNIANEIPIFNPDRPDRQSRPIFEHIGIIHRHIENDAPEVPNGGR